MRPFHLPRSATSPDLPSSPTDSTTSPAHENAINRDGAISRVDRYSRIIPPAPTNPPPPPKIANSSRPSGLRHVTLASEIKTTMKNSMELSISSTASSLSTPQTSLPTDHGMQRKNRFRLNTARQGMQKAFSSMRTHASPSNIAGLSLRKKGSVSGSGVSAEMVPGSSAGSAGSVGSTEKISIGAPTGMIKKTPEEIQEILRQLGVNGKDLSSSGGSSGSFHKNAVFGEDVGIAARGDRVGDGKGKVQKEKRTTRANSTTSQSTSNSRSKFIISSNILPYPKISTSTSTSAPKPKVKLSAKQRGKLPARSPSPPPPSSTLSPEPEQEKKPVGWYTTATLDEIRATLPPVRKEDLIPDEEIPEFVEGLMRDFEVLKWVSEWRSGLLDEEIEEMRRVGLGGGGDEDEDEDKDEDKDDHENYDDEDEEYEEDEEEEEYTWPETSKINPRFIESGWCQEEISSSGIGARWFIFDDVENILGGPKCPLTHAADDVEDDEDEYRDEVEDQDEIKYEQITETRSMIGESEESMRGDDRYGFEEDFAAEEEFDEDARQITREEILRGEFKFTQLEILERRG